LTGFTRLTDYSSPTNSYVRFLNTQGYHTEGFTAVPGWFYDRAAVSRHLGFTKYYFLDDFENSSQEDSFFFPTVRALYDARDRERPYFSFNLSAQNHAPFYDWYTKEPHLIAQGQLSETAFNILNNYLHGLYDTTLRLEHFIDGLRNDPDPVVVLVCGDHMSWLGNSYLVYDELGINIDRRTAEGFFNYYSTPYFIWANDAAKSVLGNDFTGYGGSFSSCFLMGELFSHISWEGDGYMQILREFKETSALIHAPSGLFLENGRLTYELSPPAAESFQRLRKAEYFRLQNFES
jgi:hypothetical protein